MFGPGGRGLPLSQPGGTPILSGVPLPPGGTWVPPFKGPRKEPGTGVPPPPPVWMDKVKTLPSLGLRMRALNVCFKQCKNIWVKVYSFIDTNIHVDKIYLHFIFTRLHIMFQMRQDTDCFYFWDGVFWNTLLYCIRFCGFPISSLRKYWCTPITIEGQQIH